MIYDGLLDILQVNVPYPLWNVLDEDYKRDFASGMPTVSYVILFAPATNNGVVTVGRENVTTSSGLHILPSNRVVLPNVNLSKVYAISADATNVLSFFFGVDVPALSLQVP